MIRLAFENRSKSDYLFRHVIYPITGARLSLACSKFLFCGVFEVDNRYPLVKENAPGAVAQLGERVVRNDEVVGSIPIGSTIYLSK